MLGGLPGMEALATKMMKSKMEKLDIPPIDEFLEILSERLYKEEGRTVNETVERLPVIVVEIEGAGQFGVLPGKMDQMEDPPGDDHIDRQTGFQ